MARYIEKFELPEYDADIITQYKPLADLFEETVALGNKPKEVSNWIMVETNEDFARKSQLILTRLSSQQPTFQN